MVLCAKTFIIERTRIPRSLDESPSEEERSPNGGELAMADIRAFFMG